MFCDGKYEQVKESLGHVRGRLHPIDPVSSAKASELTMARHKKLRRRFAAATSQLSASRSSRTVPSLHTSVVSEVDKEIRRRERRLRVESSSDF